MDKRAEIMARFGNVRWFVAAERGRIQAVAEGKRKELTQALEKPKAQLRACVEHPFHIVKNLFRHRKARYRGILKNTAQLHTLLPCQPGDRQNLRCSDPKTNNEPPKPSK